MSDSAAVEEQTLTHNKLEAPAWVSFWAGTFAGMVGIFVGQPFDVIKVRQQTLNYGSLLQCVLKTIRQEGPFALYKGIIPPMVGSMAVNAVLFFTYDYVCQELVKRRLPEGALLKEQSPTTTEMVLASLVAGFVQTWVVTPFEAVKVRLQCEVQHTYKGTLDCAKKIYSQSGIRGLFKGVVITLYRDVPSFPLYFVVYEKLKDKVGVLAAGGISGCTCWASIYPLDVIKSRLQTDSLTDRKYNGILDCAKKSYQQEGFKVFWKGFPATMTRGFVANAGTFFGYEQFMRFYKLASGSPEKLATT